MGKLEGKKTIIALAVAALAMGYRFFTGGQDLADTEVQQLTDSIAAIVELAALAAALWGRAVAKGPLLKQ